MSFLKQLPINYVGELHEVKLINFSVAMEEVCGLVPSGIKVRNFDGRAIISMVNVKLKKMRPDFFPKGLSFNYQHVAFRLLVNDAEFNDDGRCRGIFFLKSFTDSPLIAQAGKLTTNYQLSLAQIEDGEEFLVSQKGKYVKYRITDFGEEAHDSVLKPTIAAIDRAYAMENGEVLRTMIQREAWPIEWVGCEHFETNFFQTAKFLGAFNLKQMIDYKWLTPQVVSKTP